MHKPLRMRLLPWVIGSLLVATTAFAQNTSSSLSGRIVDVSGNAVAGATVEIVHVPSGTSRTVVTDANGRYTAQGLRVGGPFDVKASDAKGEKADQPNVYLQLAQETTLNLTVGATATMTLEGIVVTAAAPGSTFQPDNKGLSTNVSRRELESTPMPSRSIQDVARLDPRVTVTDKGDGSISANGQNSRYNNISVDGVSQGDPFGLNSNGLPYIGSPISVDTIEEYNISTANYDVTSDTVGAAINAVTKSGTNDFHGSAYYAYRNANKMVGTAGWLPESDPGYDYKGYRIDWTGGMTLGGPIIKDKLFFFLNYEQEKTVGLGADSANGLDYSLGDGPSTSNKVSPGDLQRIITAANNLGLKPGTFSGGTTDLTDKRYLAKLDWNIADGHRASLTYQSTKENQPIVQGNASNSVGLTSYWYNKNSDTKNTVLQFFDDWSDTFSTEAKFSSQRFQQVRTVDDQQPQIFVDLTFKTDPKTGKQSGTSPYVDLGEDQYSHYNVLDVKTDRAYLAGTWYLGAHTVTGGVDVQRNQIYNLFGRTQFGAYTFYGIDNFEKGIYGSYNIYQPGNGYMLADVAARWTLKQYSIFLQDTWQATDRFSLQYGIRTNIAATSDKPAYNAKFEQTFGYRNDNTIDGMFIIEPRVSFNYEFDTERKTQLRGGIGVFQSNPPTVWMTNPYSNNGVTTTSYTVYNDCGYAPTGNNNYTCDGKPVGYLPVFSPDPFAQDIPPNGGQGPVDTIAKNFKLPSVGKLSLGLDRELPWGNLVASAEYQHVAVINGILYSAINLGAPDAQVLPDGRLQYWKTPGEAGSSGDALVNRNRSFATSSTLLSNTNKGKSDSLTLSVRKPFADNWAASVAATFGRSTEVNPGTSSQASSNYSNNVWVNPNENVASISNYDIRQRLSASLSWQHKFFGDNSTGISMFYDGHSGQPYSWTFGNDANGDSYRSDLVYIPNPGDVSFKAGTKQSTIDQFYSYINSDSYLKDHKGQIASRNGARASWINQIDMSFRQEIPGLFKGNKGEVRLDVYNLLNLLNNSWGQVNYVGFPYTRTLANYAGVDAQGHYIYDLPTDKSGNYQPTQETVYDAGRNTKTNVVSRWSAMITLRYTF